MDRRSFIRNSAVAAGALLGARAVIPRWFRSVDASTVPYRAFSDASEWNRPLPVDAPVDPRSDAFIGWLNDLDDDRFPRLAAGRWAEPIYWAGVGDPEFDIAPLPFPVRIPVGARPAATSDAQMTVYDVERGYVAKLHKAELVGDDWTARWTALYNLASNGLHGSLPGSDDRANRGHRGFPPPIHAVRWDEVAAGEIRHVLKVAIHRTAPYHVYPGAGDEGGSGVIPEGAIFRIKPTVDLSGRGLDGAALVIATAMQRYGVVIGDQSGAPMALKVENLDVTGSPNQWSDLGVDGDALSRVSFDDLECIQLGYHRP